MKPVLSKADQKKVDSWRWRIIKCCGELQKFAEKTGRSNSQISDWITGTKTPEPASIAAVEKDLKRLGG